MKTKIVITVLLSALLTACEERIRNAPIDTSAPPQIGIVATESTPRSLATISVDYKKDFLNSINAGNTISIANTGSVVAQKLTIWICASQINPYWQFLHNISSLSAVPENRLDYSLGYRRENICPQLSETQRNAIAVKFNTLSPNQVIDINIKLGEGKQTILHTYNGNVWIKYPTEIPMPSGQNKYHFESMISVLATDKLMEDLRNKSLIAGLIVGIECENCSTREEDFSYHGAMKLFSSSCAQATRGSEYSRIHCQITYEYYTPESSPDFALADEDIHFLLLQNYGIYSFKEIDKGEFEANLPYSRKPPNTACSGQWGFGRDFGAFCAGVEFWRGGFPVRPTAANAIRWHAPC